MFLGLSLFALLACFSAARAFPVQEDVDFGDRALLRQLMQLQSDSASQSLLQNYLGQLQEPEFDDENFDEENLWEEWMKKENKDSQVWNEQNRVERQHWSDKYRPGGKRSNPFAHGLPMVVRQHWSDWYRPGGKKYNQESDADLDLTLYLNELKTLLDGGLSSLESSKGSDSSSDQPFDIDVLPPPPRQHWSMAYRPGGKRLNSAKQEEPRPLQHTIQKRQHWSKGLSPGGKRSVDLADFDESGHRLKRDGGMTEAVFHVEQPKPAYPKPIEKAESDGKISDTLH